MTRGSRSSEKTACYHAFYVGAAMAVFGLWKGVDLAGLAALVPAVGTPLMWYAANRSFVKGKQGENDDAKPQ